MRPITKGEWPIGPDGHPIDFFEHGEARPELIQRIGDYCSYCEMHLPYLHVEHMQPKGVVPGVALNWNNFLLACPSCNSIKGHAYLNINDYYWPDTHNTHLLFDFLPGGIVVMKSGYSADIDTTRVENTFKLTGLGRYAHNTTIDDRRWLKRKEAEDKAVLVALHYYVSCGMPESYIPSIVSMATGSGFLSVWMKVFESYPEVQDALIEGFAGTYPNCLTGNINRL